jgi:hypothetical protein
MKNEVFFITDRYLHLDWWRGNLPQSAKVVGIPDAGWFFDAANVDGFFFFFFVKDK